MTTYREATEEFPELADLPTFGLAWWTRYKELHLAKYPDSDQQTVAAFDQCIRRAEGKPTR